MPRAEGIIALDLDGTLLNSRKELSQGNLTALQQAAQAGWEIVPTTGRFYDGMPDVIRRLPFVHYAIVINGARVIDLKDGKTLYQAKIPWREAVDIMEQLDRLPVIYDCYMDDAAWMTASMKERVDQVIEDGSIRKMFHELRQPVPELKAFLTERRHDVQKVQFFTRKQELRTELLNELPQRFAEIAVSSSSPQNVEINQKDAEKGKALLALADFLKVSKERVAAFGDGLNDLSMLRAAGTGIAMENGLEQVKAAADRITRSCDEDGVAWGVYRYCLGAECVIGEEE